MAASSAQRALAEDFEVTTGGSEAWESALLAPLSPLDALDLAMRLEGAEASSDELSGLTVRSNDRVPAPLSGDDGDPPSPDSLGRAWLAQATQSEVSFSEADLRMDVEDLAELDEVTEILEDEDRPSYA